MYLSFYSQAIKLSMIFATNTDIFHAIIMFEDLVAFSN